MDKLTSRQVLPTVQNHWAPPGLRRARTFVYTHVEVHRPQTMGNFEKDKTKGEILPHM